MKTADLFEAKKPARETKITRTWNELTAFQKEMRKKIRELKAEEEKLLQKHKLAKAEQFSRQARSKFKRAIRVGDVIRSTEEDNRGLFIVSEVDRTPTGKQYAPIIHAFGADPINKRMPKYQWESEFTDFTNEFRDLADIKLVENPRIEYEVLINTWKLDQDGWHAGDPKPTLIRVQSKEDALKEIRILTNQVRRAALAQKRLETRASRWFDPDEWSSYASIQSDVTKNGRTTDVHISPEMAISIRPVAIVG